MIENTLIFCRLVNLALSIESQSRSDSKSSTTVSRRHEGHSRRRSAVRVVWPFSDHRHSTKERWCYPKMHSQQRL
jgi:hypothetical protein